MTSLAAERAEQARWKLLPRFAGFDVFNQLVENEFTLPEQAANEEARALRRIVDLATARVPHYRDLFARLGLKSGDIRDRRDLTRLPFLTRDHFLESFDRLKPDALPPGVEIAGVAKSSGTTGPPVQVLYSTFSNQMFTFLNQRHLRWFRRDPMQTLATLRGPANMPQPSPGRPLADRETLRTERWTHVGAFFETGPNVYFNYTNPVDAQLAWLRRERPAYLTTRAHCLEHLALGAAGGRPCDSLKAVTGVSEGLTPETRRYLESVFGAQVQTGYGLNEIGLVSALCEAGRYHVHREHCIVEIVDEAGMPVAGGAQGRLVITGLLNIAMPLLRYDTGDLVTALDGPCPCGRTLPTHGEIHGRLSRIRALPQGTLTLVASLRRALQQTPANIGRDLRRYQIHQFRDGRFELRLVAVAPIPEEFRRLLGHAWTVAAGAGAPPLAIREVEDIPIHTDGTKFDDFVSEYSLPKGTR